MPSIKPINNLALLTVLSVFQLFTGYFAANAGKEFSVKVIATLAVFILVEWIYVSAFYFIMHRRNFELELIAFFLTVTGLAVIG